MKYGTAVVFNGGAGKEKQLAFVVGGTGETKNLVVLGDEGVSHENSVPRRDPSDYAAGGGGGRTWHPAD